MGNFIIVIIGSRNSVCPSVCHTHALWWNQTMHCRYFNTTWKGNHSSFLTPAVVGERCSLPVNLHLKWPTLFEKRRHRQISAYNVSTVRYSEKSSIMTNRKSTTGFPTSYRWSVYITHKSPKGSRVAQKLIFCFLSKVQFQSNKVCYKVSLCENFQRQSCSMTMSPSNGP